MLILILYEENIAIVEAKIIHKPKKRPTIPHVLKLKKNDCTKTIRLKIIKSNN